jgi:hypothetical protein
MAGVELLYDMIRTTNSAILEEYGVFLDASNLRFTELYPGVFDDGMNTAVMGTAFGTQIEGSQVYYYKRHDLTEAFHEIGVDDVTVELDGEPTYASIMYALRTKYNLPLGYEEVKTYTFDGSVATITPIDQSYVWIGTLQINVVEGSLSLAAQFPNNVLNGLTAPGATEPTDGGNYDELVARDFANLAPVTNLSAFDPA